MKIDSIELVEDHHYEEEVKIKNFTQTVFKPGIEYKLFEIDFSRLKPIYKTKEARYIVKIKSYENIFSFKVVFPFEMLLCSTNQDNPVKYVDCR